MKRHPALIFLSRDHHHGLILSQLVKKNAPLYKGLPHDLAGKITYVASFHQDELKKHFFEEENILFEFVKTKNKYFEESVNQLKEEHRQLSELVSCFSETKDPETVLHDFGVLLEQHIRFEERELFEKIQLSFSDDELDQLTKKLDRENHSSDCITSS
jgi:hemerythrin-like domain-containing protein